MGGRHIPTNLKARTRMQDRFTLRFQNGEREGDTVPLSSARFTLGRRPGNTLQIQDGSVSGQHAELIVEGQEVLLRDLGSTNGTKVGGRKVTEVALAHGDTIHFGSIAAVFSDGEFAEASPAPSAMAASSAGNASDAGEGVERVSADLIAKSGKRSKVALIGILALLIGGGGVAGYLMTGGGGSRARQVKPVIEVDGNKLAGFSFEGESIPDNWTRAEAATADFDQRGDARSSGEDGVRAVLSAGQWSRLNSEAIPVTAGRSLEVVGKLRANGKAAGRLGIEFSSGDGSAADVEASNIAWGPWIADVSQHQDVIVSAAIPAGARSARAVIEARAEDPVGEVTEEDPGEGGYVDADDIALTDGTSSTDPAAKIGEASLWLHGQPATVGQLTKVSRPLLGDLRFEGDARLRDYPIEVKQTEGRMSLSSSAANQLSLRVEAKTAEEGLAMIGPSGYSELGGEFETADVRTLLLGGGHDLVALNFSKPVSVRGRREGAGLRLSIPLSSGAFDLQVDFRDERVLAGDLAFAARKAEEAGQLGECLAKWNELLASAPYEVKLIQEARETRGRLEQAGLVELAGVSRAFEQASFFRLVDLFRQCRTRAQAVGSKYAGSQVETQAADLVTKIDESLSGLEADLSQDEVDRLNSILRVLEASESPRLASEVRNYIEDEFGARN